jgi:hypothetical protein
VTATYNTVDIVMNGQRVGSANVAVGVDWALRGGDDTGVAVMECKPSGNYEVKFAMAMNQRQARRLMGRSAPLCWKCCDGRTRAHHRLCSKRGGKLERFKAAYTAEVLAAYRGKPSPGRLNWRATTTAQAFGKRIAETVRESERVRGMYRVNDSTPERLNELAAMLGVA